MKEVWFYYLTINLLIFVTNVRSIFFINKLPWYIEQDRVNSVNLWPDKFYSNPMITDYDFIIVGAGPAGCVLANRLTENPKWRVLLLEAGREDTIIHRIPIMAGFLQATETSWDYTTEPQDGVCLGMKDQRCGYPRGKGIGGSSLINYMIYNRGNKEDFNTWNITNPGWSYDDVLPYFKKSERTNMKELENSSYHGRTGAINVEDVSHRTKMARAFVKGSMQTGYASVDYNGESQIGTSFVQANTLFGRRHSAATAYLEPIKYKRSNLHIISSARVTKVLIDPATKRAYGVKFAKDKKYYEIKAKKEVILSAGAFNSPQLLMLSGIGPADHLKEINVPLIKNLPVGQTMYDHMSHFGPTFIVNTTSNSIHTQTLLTWENYMLFKQGRGPFVMIGGVEALTFMKTTNSQMPKSVPDIELIFVGGTLASDEGTGLRQGMKITDELYNAVYKPLEDPNIDAFSILVMLFHPRSKGNMKLKDNNPFHWPKFYPNFFQDPEDVEAILQGIKETIRISKTPAMQRINTRLHDIPIPSCAHLTFGTDDYWRCSIRTFSCTLHHQVSTCKMGLESDPTSVVNHKLQVHGIRRLRVVDTSVIPEPPSAHTNAISVMIGEKAADMIKNKYDRSTKVK